jgi:hypothetical protein
MPRNLDDLNLDDPLLLLAIAEDDDDLLEILLIRRCIEERQGADQSTS